ncbi:hypothetical protein A2U01_0001927 [Trifolium medium]|uniref:Ty3 transposon capsid-like protein domain-containing protein n=1 Tax=Trifolium medium TaxID=97028 RepID=A0A392M1K3_9FABA|nr:hypothetical protein [Trifolium medium]
MGSRNPPPPPTVQDLHDSINALAAAFTQFRTTQDNRHNDYLASFESLNSQIPPTQSSSSTTSPDNSLKPPKLRLLPFDGSNPLDWVFQANQFFDHYSIPHYQRLTHVPGYITGEALGWFQWLYNNHLLSTWDAFTTALETRFGPSSFDNHQQALFKLKQTTTVADYQREFERLCNRVTGLPSLAIVDCFISGLKPEIHHELAIHQPQSISHAIGLAKLIESKTLATRAPTAPFQKTPPPKPPLLPTPSSKLLSPTTSTPSSFPIKRLSSAEMQVRRSKGLCFNCDERFHTGHRCKNKQFLILLHEEPDPNPDPLYALLTSEIPDPAQIPSPSSLLPTTPAPDPNPPPSTQNDSELFHLSLQAAIGHPSPRTLRFTATIHNHHVTVLVDSGSSHNIIQPIIASFLNLTIQPLSSFSVMVGNGEHLHCTGLCADIPINVNKHTFNVSLYVLPIQGADVVLGVQWLQTLGPFVSDFTIPSMQFYHQDSLLTITGTKPSPVTPASYNQINRMLHTNSIATFHSITIVPLEDDTNHPQPSDNQTIQSLPTDLQTVLQPYNHIFTQPQGLPPH